MADNEEIKKLVAEVDGLSRDTFEVSEKIQELQREVAQSREAAKDLVSIAARAAEEEVSELNKILEEKASTVEFLEKELTGLKKVKAESEDMFKDAVRKTIILETKVVEEQIKRIMFQKEMMDKIHKKDREIKGFRLKVEELEKVATEDKSKLEETLRESEEKAIALELSILRLREEAIALESEEKAVETVENIDRGVNGEGKGLKLQWPVVAAGSTGAVVAAAAIIYCYGKRK